LLKICDLFLVKTVQNLSKIAQNLVGLLFYESALIST